MSCVQVAWRSRECQLNEEPLVTKPAAFSCLCILNHHAHRLHMRERADAEPMAECAPHGAGSMHREALRFKCLGQGRVAAPDIDHVGQSGFYEQIGLPIRRFQAEFAPAGLVQEPSVVLPLDLIGGMSAR